MRCRLVFQQQILVESAGQMTTQKTLHHAEFHQTTEQARKDSAVFCLIKISITFEYPKSQILTRGAVLPSNSVFSSLRSL